MGPDKRFTIDGKEFFVQELCIAQDELLAELLSHFDLARLMDLDTQEFLQRVAEKKLLRRFLAILLIPVNGEFDEDKIPEIEEHTKKAPTGTALEVARDFLSKNENWLGYLRSSLAGPAVKPEAVRGKKKPIRTDN